MPYSSIPTRVPVKNMRRRATLFFTLSTLVIVYAVTLTLYIVLGRLADKKESRILESAARQLSLSVNNYLSEQEQECNDVFLNETISDYYPGAGDTEHDREKLKNDVKNQLSHISAGKCYNDFFIVYSNSDTVGNVSQGAQEIVSKHGFSAFDNALEGSFDKWSFAHIGKASKVFYMRKMSDSSIFVMSFHANNINIVFPAHDDISAVNYILTTINGIVITSDIDKAESGKALPGDCESMFKGDNEVIINENYVGARTLVTGDWRVYAITQNRDFYPSLTILISVTTIAVACIILICYMTGLLSFLKFSVDDGEITGSEYLDPITGRLNEYGLDEMISDMLETSLVGSIYGFFIIGIKDSEQIKSTVSLRYWNDIRIKLSDKTEEYFKDRDHHIGRAYDDYIIVFADYSEFDLFKAHAELEKNCAGLGNFFKDFTVGEQNELKLDIVIGASVYPDHGDDFDTLLGKARQAYKTASDKPKLNYHIFKNRTGSDSKGGSK